MSFLAPPRRFRSCVRAVRSSRIRSTALVSTLAAAASLVACGVQPSPGELRVGLSSAPTCADPRQASTNATVGVARQVVDSLVDQDPRSGEIVGWLALRWETSRDGEAITFHLRPDATFSDGSAVSAAVIRANFDDVAHTMSASTSLLASGFLQGYVGTDVVDPLTARVRFDRPNVQFLQAAATTQLGIVGQATLDKPVSARCDGPAVVGSGPFVYTSWNQGRSVDLARRVGYSWGSPVTGGGSAVAERVRYTVVPESGVRVGSVAAGQLDLATDNQPEDRETLDAAGGRTISHVNPGLPYVFQPNFSRAVPADAGIRRAVSLAVDRTELVDAVLGREFHPATGVLASTTPDALSYLSPEPDVVAAAAILDAAGWTRNGDGVRRKDGRALEFSVLFSPEFPTSQSILELIQQQLRAVGIGMTIDKVTNADFLSRRNAGNFDFVYYNVTRGDPDILRVRLGRDGANYSRRQFDARLDPLLAQQLAVSDAARRGSLVDAAQRYIADQSLVIPIVELSQVVSLSKSVLDVAFDASAVLRLQRAHIA